MIVGLQGSGKTTTCAKLAKYLKKNGHSPLLAPADVNRPAAIEQLHIVAKEAGVQSFKTLEKTPVAICNAALEEAKAKGWDALIIDTAGRLHLDEALMDELALIKAACCPNEILFVADAMTGQDAVRSAESFNNKIGLTGVILTKTDGDSRGGAAFSIKQTLGRPIVFVGTGEKTDDFERFYPDRMAQRILGMGDVLTLIEHAKEKIGESEAERIAKRLESNQFSLEDMRSHFRQIQKLGSMNKLLGMIPGISQFKGQLENVITDKRMKHMEAILDSMTRKERQNHNLLDAKRKRRISLGSGRPVQEINQLLKQFQEMKKMMSQFANPGFRKKIQSFVGQNKFPFM
jgi:signal recognition particle subunit SRP54